MQLGDTIPEPGTIFDWDISEILTRRSVDAGMIEGICDRCNAVAYDGWGFDDVDKNHDCNEFIRDATIQEIWDNLLANKRDDDQYPDVLNSIRAFGFIRPCTSWPNTYEGYLQFGDGHHRLAAAIELGMTTVPVKVYATWAVAHDSGDWFSSEPVPSLEEFEAKL